MPSSLHDEILANFAAFESQWPKELATAQNRLAVAKKDFEGSYVRIASIQAWRTSVIFKKLNADAEAFFFEAQNDFLTSHCLARCGSFRQALKALRSALENVYFALFYKDHPVELQKWLFGKHKPTFTELHVYFESHPATMGSGNQLTGISALREEYSTLSKAVHGSAKTFRMTQNLQEIRLWGDDAASVGRWATRERTVIINLNLLLIHFFCDDLLGAKNRNLRESIGLVLPKAQRDRLKQKLKVTLIGA